MDVVCNFTPVEPDWPVVIMLPPVTSRPFFSDARVGRLCRCRGPFSHAPLWRGPSVALQRCSPRRRKRKSSWSCMRPSAPRDAVTHIRFLRTLMSTPLLPHSATQRSAMIGQTLEFGDIVIRWCSSWVHSWCLFVSSAHGGPCWVRHNLKRRSAFSGSICLVWPTTVQLNGRKRMWRWSRLEPFLTSTRNGASPPSSVIVKCTAPQLRESFLSLRVPCARKWFQF